MLHPTIFGWRPKNSSRLRSGKQQWENTGKGKIPLETVIVMPMCHPHEYFITLKVSLSIKETGPKPSFAIGQFMSLNPIVHWPMRQKRARTPTECTLGRRTLCPQLRRGAWARASAAAPEKSERRPKKPLAVRGG